MLKDYFNLKERNIQIEKSGRYLFFKNSFIFSLFLFILLGIFCFYFISTVLNIEIEQQKIIFNVLNNNNLQDLYYNYGRYDNKLEIMGYFENISNYKNIDNDLFKYFSIENLNLVEKEQLYSLGKKYLTLIYEGIFLSVFVFLSSSVFLLRHRVIFQISFKNSVIDSLVFVVFLTSLFPIFLLPFYMIDIYKINSFGFIGKGFYFFIIIYFVFHFVILFISFINFCSSKKENVSSLNIEEYNKNDKKINNIENEYIFNKNIDEIIKEAESLDNSSQNDFFNLLDKKKRYQCTFEKLKGEVLND